MAKMEMKNLKVLHVIGSMATQNGGPPVSVLGISLATAPLGVTSSIVTTDCLVPVQSSGRRGGADIGDFPVGADQVAIRIAPLSHPYRIAYSRRLKPMMVEGVQWADVVHVHSLNLYPQFVAFRSAERLGKPLIVSPRGALDPWVTGPRRWLRAINNFSWQSRMLSSAAAIHFTAEEERELASTTTRLQRGVVIPNGVNTSRFRAGGDADAFRALHLKGFAGTLVINHGRLSPKKGLDVLLEAVALIRDTRDLRLVLIGADDEGVGDQLRQRAASLGVSDVLVILPPMDGQDLVNAVSSAEVWCLPSYSENFGLAVFEAMAAGRAVVTSPHVNTAAEAATANALVMVPNTPEEIAAALVRLLESPEERGRLGQAASKYAQRFSWDSIAPQYLEMYEDVIFRHGSRR